ncbi:MAG: hypothetical protein J0G32_07645 [Alphaproteobacteria bacterium]|jgi:hypothetical protein|nr:hypothetical protein [Alphaproteobacteria bacterium]OJV12537.1 MAG: hypothetical protein BGO27_03335 [Alphaproteobacteria bacterium 33-17]
MLQYCTDSSGLNASVSPSLFNSGEEVTAESLLNELLDLQNSSIDPLMEEWLKERYKHFKPIINRFNDNEYFKLKDKRYRKDCYKVIKYILFKEQKRLEAKKELSWVVLDQEYLINVFGLERSKIDVVFEILTGSGIIEFMGEKLYSVCTSAALLFLNNNGLGYLYNRDCSYIEEINKFKDGERIFDMLSNKKLDAEMIENGHILFELKRKNPTFIKFLEIIYKEIFAAHKGYKVRNKPIKYYASKCGCSERTIKRYKKILKLFGIKFLPSFFKAWNGKKRAYDKMVIENPKLVVRIIESLFEQHEHKLSFVDNNKRSCHLLFIKINNVQKRSIIGTRTKQSDKLFSENPLFKPRLKQEIDVVEYYSEHSDDIIHHFAKKFSKILSLKDVGKLVDKFISLLFAEKTYKLSRKLFVYRLSNYIHAKAKAQEHCGSKYKGYKIKELQDKEYYVSKKVS